MEKKQYAIAGRYVLEQLIGKGSFGSIYKGYDNITQEPIAVKLVKNLFKTLGTYWTQVINITIRSQNL